MDTETFGRMHFWAQPCLAKMCYTPSPTRLEPVRPAVRWKENVEPDSNMSDLVSHGVATQPGQRDPVSAVSEGITKR
jgi:hypothetical protein